MGKIFTSPARPFYQSVLIMNLRSISVEKYIEFAQLHVLFLKTLPGECCKLEKVDSAQNYILDMFTETYSDLLDRIPEKQREVFLAIAEEGVAKNVSSKAFIKKYHLQTVSVVTAALRGLLDKDFITQDKDGYIVYDPFFALWLQQNIRH